MSIYLTPEQEHFVRTRLELGKYHSVEEVLEVALSLLNAHDSAESDWVMGVREKIDAAITASEQIPAVAGEKLLTAFWGDFNKPVKHKIRDEPLSDQYPCGSRPRKY